jgi:hypothetical protein
MDIQELMKLLKKENVAENWHSLDGTLIPDRMIIRQLDNKWEVFYLGDRGYVTKEKQFENESEACKYLYQTLIETKQRSNRKM